MENSTEQNQLNIKKAYEYYSKKYYIAYFYLLFFSNYAIHRFYLGGIGRPEFKQYADWNSIGYGIVLNILIYFENILKNNTFTLIVTILLIAEIFLTYYNIKNFNKKIKQELCSIKQPKSDISIENLLLILFILLLIVKLASQLYT